MSRTSEQPFRWHNYDPFPGPAWSLAWDGPGTRAGTGSMLYLPPGAVTTEVVPSQRYLGGWNNTGRYSHPDPAVAGLQREILRSGDDVTRRLGTRIYWAMNEVHPKVASSIETLVDDALALPITLKVAVDGPRRGEDPSPEAELAARILGECQESIDRLKPSLEDVLRPVVESLCVEFSGAAEPVWEAVTPPGGTPSYRLVRLADLPREAWEFIVDRFNAVVGYAGLDPDGRPVVLPPAKLAVMTWRPRAGDPGGRAMLRPAYADCDLTWRLHDPYFQHVKNFSDPFRVGKAKNSVRNRLPGIDPAAHPLDPTPGRISAAESMHAMLEHAGTSGFAVIGDEDDILTTYPQGAGEAYLNAFRFTSDNIVEAIVGDVRATQQATYGSRASAEVGADNKSKRVLAIRRMICSFVAGVLRTQNELNYGPEVAAEYTPYVLFQDPEEVARPADWAAVGYRINDTIHQAELDAKLGLTPREVGSEESTDNRMAQATIAETYERMGVPARLALERAGWTEDELAEYDRAVAERVLREEPLRGDGAPEAGSIPVPISPAA